MLLRGIHLGQLLVASPILAMPLVVALHMPAPLAPTVDEPMEVTDGPAMVIAVMVSDLDEQGTGLAAVDDGQPVTIHAGPEIGPQLRGSEVLVYHSTLWDQWRLVSTDLGVLSPGLRQ